MATVLPAPSSTRQCPTKPSSRVGGQAGGAASLFGQASGGLLRPALSVPPPHAPATTARLTAPAQRANAVAGGRVRLTTES